MFVLLNK